MKNRRIRQLLAGTLALALAMPAAVYGEELEAEPAAQEETVQEEVSELPQEEPELPEEPKSDPQEEPQESFPEAAAEEEALPQTFDLEAEPRAAGWVQSGERWQYQNEDGSCPQTQWQMIDGVYYYFDAEGFMTTGWQYVDGSWYYLDEQGRMTSGWKLLDGNWYYLNASGVMQTGMITVGGYTYYMNEQGVEQFAWVQTGGVYDYYYFDFPSGRMATGWRQIDGQWYYFAQDGKMQYGWQDIDGYRYYLGPSGAMLTGWQYLGAYCYYFDAQGHLMTGWQKIDGVQYYLYEDGRMHGGWLTQGGTTYYFHANGSQAFDEWVGNAGVGGRYINKYGRLVTDGAYSVGGTLYTFDSNGFCIGTGSRYITAQDPLNGKTYKLEAQFRTDPQMGSDVTEQEFLAAVLYTEAGNQGLEGQIAAGLVLLNRTESKSFPDSLNFVVYQSSQFEVARNGSLTKYLRAFLGGDQSTLAPLIQARSMEAAKKAMEIMENHRLTGAPRTIGGITLPNGKTDFDYLYFMTPSAFESLGLNKEKCDYMQYNGHVFFKTWVK